MLISKETQSITIDQLPLILALNKQAEPLSWVSYEDSAYYYSKEKVLWSMGSYEVILRGGTNAKTGLQSKLVMDTIIAIDSDKSPFSYKKHAPTLSNIALFQRDKHLCAYCGNQFKRQELTRDHVTPTSRGGLDIWDNVVAACKACNSKKDDLLLSETNMELLFIPYTPNFHEHLILQNKKILMDQMEFLMKGVSKHSRLHLL